MGHLLLSQLCNINVYLADSNTYIVLCTLCYHGHILTLRCLSPYFHAVHRREGGLYRQDHTYRISHEGDQNVT